MDTRNLERHLSMKTCKFMDARYSERHLSIKICNFMDTRNLERHLSIKTASVHENVMELQVGCAYQAR
jgi:hypothetical protein